MKLHLIVIAIELIQSMTGNIAFLARDYAMTVTSFCSAKERHRHIGGSKQRIRRNSSIQVAYACKLLCVKLYTRQNTR